MSHWGVAALVRACAGPFVPEPESPAGAYEECNDFYDKEQLREWMAELEKPRHTGTKAHREFVAYIARRVEDQCHTNEAESESRSTGCRIEALPQRFELWEIDEDGLRLEVAGQDIDVAGYLPYSGLTNKDGVTAQLYYEGRWRLWSRFQEEKHKNKIVVIRLRPWSLRKILLPITERSYPRWLRWRMGRYRRTISLDAQVPKLRRAHEAGVKGLIVILDMDEDLARNQYVPFRRGPGKVPGLYVTKSHRKLLKKAARDGEHATLVLPGEKKPDTKTDHLVVTLPATDASVPDDSREVILINTHTDGPNFLEENGVVALWALLGHFAKITERHRDLVFLFATGHFAHDVGSTDDFVRRRQDIIGRTRAAVTIEHLGAKAWRSDKPEPALFFLTNNSKKLNEEARRFASKLDRVFLIKPGLLKFGEGAHLEREEIPTLGYLTNPGHLLSSAPDGHLPMLDSNRMCEELKMFRCLIDTLMQPEF